MDIVSIINLIFGIFVGVMLGYALYLVVTGLEYNPGSYSNDFEFGDTVYVLWPKHGHYQQDFEPFSGEPVGSLSEKQKGTLCEVREFTYVSENDIATRAHVVKSDMGYIYEVDANIYQDREEAEQAMEEHNRGVIKDNISENAREIRDLHSRLGELEDVVSNLHMKLENDNDE